MSQVGLKKYFEYFLCIPMVQTQESLGLGHFGPGGNCLKNLVRDHIPNFKHLSLAPKPSSVSFYFILEP